MVLNEELSELHAGTQQYQCYAITIYVWRQDIDKIVVASQTDLENALYHKPNWTKQSYPFRNRNSNLLMWNEWTTHYATYLIFHHLSRETSEHRIIQQLPAGVIRLWIQQAGRIQRHAHLKISLLRKFGKVSPSNFKIMPNFEQDIIKIYKLY